MAARILRGEVIRNAVTNRYLMPDDGLIFRNGQESLAASIDHILEQQAVQAQTYLAQASEETYKRNLDLSEEADFSESTDEWQETFWQDELDNDSIPDSDLEEQEDEMDFEFSDNESDSSDGTETRAVTAAMTMEHTKENINGKGKSDLRLDNKDEVSKISSLPKVPFPSTKTGPTVDIVDTAKESEQRSVEPTKTILKCTHTKWVPGNATAPPDVEMADASNQISMSREQRPTDIREVQF
ncbi:hypothetical protein BDP27DRAFT_1369587 [Rhodocollybia butyracea]|uniref:Uncharacterized protein n=1 Tax=Rhodocollybia butyracea TaxID=206335 RepID=A0A9P5PCU9_9AGAR|nr:hypothetical protein BDP27DRAFT_1369587 [Rhodocollybia butyracea]